MAIITLYSNPYSNATSMTRDTTSSTILFLLDGLCSRSGLMNTPGILNLPGQNLIYPCCLAIKIPLYNGPKDNRKNKRGP